MERWRLEKKIKSNDESTRKTSKNHTYNEYDYYSLDVSLANTFCFENYIWLLCGLIGLFIRPKQFSKDSLFCLLSIRSHNSVLKRIIHSNRNDSIYAQATKPFRNMRHECNRLNLIIILWFKKKIIAHFMRSRFYLFGCYLVVHVISGLLVHNNFYDTRGQTCPTATDTCIFGRNH